LRFFSNKLEASPPPADIPPSGEPAARRFAISKPAKSCVCDNAAAPLDLREAYGIDV
jgi:hypothetical protein